MKKILSGLIEAAKWISYPSLGILIAAILGFLVLLLEAFFYLIPPVLVLLSIIGFIIGYRRDKE